MEDLIFNLIEQTPTIGALVWVYWLSHRHNSESEKRYDEHLERLVSALIECVKRKGQDSA